MSKKHHRQLKSRNESGFTLVNIAGLVVSTGVMVGAVNTSYEWATGQTGRSFYQEVKQVEDAVWAYRDRVNYWPGDCDHDNIIGFHPANAVTPPAENSDTPAASSCENKLSREASLTAFLDMENNGLATNKHISPWFSDTATVSIGHGEVNNKNYNVIVVYDVPKDLAQWIDREVDGISSGQLGRVRRWDQTDHGSTWPSEQDAKVAIAYYFEKSAPGK